MQTARVAERIYEKALLLKEYPEIGYRYQSEPEGKIRILLYVHYRIAYLLAQPIGPIDHSRGHFMARWKWIDILHNKRIEADMAFNRTAAIVRQPLMLHR